MICSRSDGDYWRRDASELDEIIRAELASEGDETAHLPDVSAALDDFLEKSSRAGSPRTARSPIVGRSGGSPIVAGGQDSTAIVVGTTNKDLSPDDGHFRKFADNVLVHDLRSLQSSPVESNEFYGASAYARDTFLRAAKRKEILLSGPGNIPAGSTPLMDGSSERRKARLDKLLEYRMGQNVAQMQKATQSRNSHREIAFPLRIGSVLLGSPASPGDLISGNGGIVEGGGVETTVHGGRGGTSSVRGTFGTATTGRMPISKQDLWKEAQADADELIAQGKKNQGNNLRNNFFGSAKKSSQGRADSELGVHGSGAGMRRQVSPEKKFRPPNRTRLDSKDSLASGTSKASSKRGTLSGRGTSASLAKQKHGEGREIAKRGTIGSRIALAVKGSPHPSGVKSKGSAKRSRAVGGSGASVLGGAKFATRAARGVSKATTKCSATKGSAKGGKRRSSKGGSAKSFSPEQARFENHVHDILANGSKKIAHSTERRQAWRSIGRERLWAMECNNGLKNGPTTNGRNSARSSPGSVFAGGQQKRYNNNTGNVSATSSGNVTAGYYTWSPKTGKKKLIRKSATPMMDSLNRM